MKRQPGRYGFRIRVQLNEEKTVGKHARKQNRDVGPEKHREHPSCPGVCVLLSEGKSERFP